jgi:putative oxidoreductase
MALNSADVKKLFQDHDLGLLIIRFFIGGAMIAYGVPKFMNGGDYLVEVGKSMGYLGIHFAPLLWGFLAALVEVMGAL